MERPSKVAVPRPISSRMTSERAVAWFRMPAVSTISTMKVERPRARSSAAPTRENRRSTMPMRAERAGTNAPIWASTTISAFWRRKVDLPAMLGPVTSHSRAGRKPSGAGLSGAVVGAAQHAVVLDELPALLRSPERLLHHGMAAAHDLEGGAVVEHGPRIALARRHLGEPRLAVELGQRARHLAQRALLGGHGGGQLGEDVLLQGQRPVGGRDDAALGLPQLLGGEPHGAGHGLAMAEDIAQRRRLQRLGGAGGRLDVVAQDVVVAHLQRLDAGLLHVPRFQRRHHLAAVVAHCTRRIEVRREALAHEAAVALQVRRVVDQRPRQHRLERRIAGRQPLGDRRQCAGQVAAGG